MTKDIVLFNKEGIVALYKRKGIATVPLKNSDNSEETLLGEASKIIPELLTVHSSLSYEGGILNRLDKDTDGIVLASTNDRSYSYMKEELESGNVRKKYYAKIEGINLKKETYPPFPFLFKDNGVIHSYFRSYGKGRKEVRPSIFKNKKTTKIEYFTKILSIRENEVYVEITRGFRHQIRSHLSWSGHPIYGDKLYGEETGELSLTALEYNFTLPSGKSVTITL